jgi:hypothetical protein
MLKEVAYVATPARGEAGYAVYTIEVEDIQTAFETRSDVRAA